MFVLMYISLDTLYCILFLYVNMYILYPFYRNKVTLTLTLTLTLYNSLILPHLQYAVLTWGHKVSRVTKLQKRAVRIITCSKYNAHTDPLFKSLNLLKLNDILDISALRLYYKFENKLLPRFFSDIFHTASDHHAHNTRGCTNLYKPRSHTASGRNCMRFFVPDINPLLVSQIKYTHIRIKVFVSMPRNMQ